MTTPTPALPPPPGVTSNFDNPPSLTRGMNIAMGVAIPLTTIFFGMRAYTRLFIRRTWIFEDCSLLSTRYSLIHNTDVCGRACAHCLGMLRVWTTVSMTPLTSPSQVGVISNAGIGAATMAHYGGKHGWDITPDQAQQASYVRLNLTPGADER